MSLIKDFLLELRPASDLDKEIPLESQSGMTEQIEGLSVSLHRLVRHHLHLTMIEFSRVRVTSLHLRVLGIFRIDRYDDFQALSFSAFP